MKKSKFLISLTIILFSLVASTRTIANDELRRVEQLFTSNVRIIDISQRVLSTAVELPATNEPRPDSLCGDSSDLGLADYGSEWVYATDSNTQQVRLCEKSTGRKSDWLPLTLSWEVYPPFSSGPLPPFSSPDGDMLILLGIMDKQTEVYTYNTSTEKLTKIGIIPCAYCIEDSPVDWFDTRITLWSYDYETHRHSIYTAELNEPNSFQLAITRPEYQPEFYDNPPRYDYINFTIPEDKWQTQCEHIVYDIRSNQIEKTDIGSLCRLELGEANGIGYYRDVTRGAEGIVSLVRYDANTQERKTLYEGEIEWVEWISPDERYAVLVLDSDGDISTPPFYSPLFNWSRPTFPRLAFIDLIRDEILFEKSIAWMMCDLPLGGPNFSWSSGWSRTSDEPCFSTGPRITILHHENNEFLIIATKEEGIGYFTQFAVLISPTDDEVLQAPLLEGNFIPYTKDYMIELRFDNTNRTRDYSLVSVTEQRRLEITTPIPFDDYDLISMTDINPLSNQITFAFVPTPTDEANGNNEPINATIEVIVP